MSILHLSLNKQDAFVSLLGGIYMHLAVGLKQTTIIKRLSYILFIIITRDLCEYNNLMK
jgi:hypothetical protein